MPRPRIRSTSSSRPRSGVGASSGSSTGSGPKASRPRKTGRRGSRCSGRWGTSWADMCRMLAIVSQKPAPVDTLMAFRALADTGRNFRDFGCPQPNPKSGHPDGWGIACIGQEGEFYARGPAKAKAGIDEEFPRKVESYTFLLIDGDRVIAHRDARTCVPYYTLHETGTEEARIVCSEVLPTLPGRWRMLRNGEFVELRP